MSVDIFVHLKDASQPKVYREARNLYTKGYMTSIAKKILYKSKATGEVLPNLEQNQCHNKDDINVIKEYVSFPTENIFSILRMEKINCELKNNEYVEVWLNSSALPVFSGEVHMMFEEGCYKWLMRTEHSSEEIRLLTQGFPIKDIYEIKHYNL